MPHICALVCMENSRLSRCTFLRPVSARRLPHESTLKRKRTKFISLFENCAFLLFREITYLSSSLPPGPQEWVRTKLLSVVRMQLYTWEGQAVADRAGKDWRRRRNEVSRNVTLNNTLNCFKLYIFSRSVALSLEASDAVDRRGTANANSTLGFN